jgi:cytochrome c553
MRRLILAAGIMIACTAALAQTSAQGRLKSIQADPAALKTAIEGGRKASSFCVNCHGAEGVSKTPEVPNLGGQNPAYLVEQIRKFGNGERVNPFMQGVIKVLKDEDRMNIALFYGSLKVPPGSADGSQVGRGKELFTKLCVRCHGEQARGDATIARLAGQQTAYLQTSIMRYRDNTGMRNNQLMSIATATLKNEDIKAIANYLTQLP